MTARKPRRAAASKELVPVRNRLWEESVKAVLLNLVHLNRTRDGYRSGAEMRQMVAQDSVARLEALVNQENSRLGTV